MHANKQTLYFAPPKQIWSRVCLYLLLKLLYQGSCSVGSWNPQWASPKLCTSLSIQSFLLPIPRHPSWLFTRVLLFSVPFFPCGWLRGCTRLRVGTRTQPRARVVLSVHVKCIPGNLDSFFQTRRLSLWAHDCAMSPTTSTQHQPEITFPLLLEGLCMTLCCEGNTAIFLEFSFHRRKPHLSARSLRDPPPAQVSFVISPKNIPPVWMTFLLLLYRASGIPSTSAWSSMVLWTCS